MASEGRLIVIEGIDGAGKTTAVDHVCNEFGYISMTQPEDSWVGDVARRALHEDVDPVCDLFLHMAAHANQQPRLRSALEKSTVVMDRYYHSRVAYQAVQTDFSPEKIINLHRDWTIEPSKVILLDVSPEEALERKSESGDKFEKVNFLSEVRSVYRTMFSDQEGVHCVNAEAPKQEVLNEVKKIITDL